MQIKTALFSKKKGFIQTSTLLLIAIGSAFFPRLLMTLKFPSLINFFHFLAVPFAFGAALFKTRTKDSQQISIAMEMLFGLLLLLAVTFASALLNDAGVINVVLSFLLFAEPFMLLVGITCIPLSSDRFERFKKWMNWFVFLHLFLVYVQRFVLHLQNLPGLEDNIQGVFYRSGSGHVVGASVASSFAVYYFLMEKNEPLWKRSFIVILGLGNILASDAKQVVITLVLGFAILSLTKSEPVKVLSYLIGIVIFGAVFTWAIYNIEALSAFTVWIRPEIYGPDGEATKVKFAGIQMTVAAFHSPLNWLLGLGPGHTIDRLGGWMLRDYAALLSPLGATINPLGETGLSVADKTWMILGNSWLANGSSFFAPFFGWAAIWGDLGFLGLGAYLYLCSIVWRKLCIGDLPKFLMLTVLVNGLIFTQMQEPGYMLYMSSLIGMHWHEQRAEKLQKRNSLLTPLESSSSF